MENSGASVTPLVIACPNVSAGLSAVTIEVMPVGNPGNPPDFTGYGRVDHEFAIGKYEVTIGRYTEFLNAVAKTDTYGLYDQRHELTAKLMNTINDALEARGLLLKGGIRWWSNDHSCRAFDEEQAKARDPAMPATSMTSTSVSPWKRV